jgi:hypothetical protein
VVGGIYVIVEGVENCKKKPAAVRTEARLVRRANHANDAIRQPRYPRDFAVRREAAGRA